MYHPLPIGIENFEEICSREFYYIEELKKQFVKQLSPRMTANAYKAIRSTKQRPVNIIVGTSRCWCYIDQNRNRSDKESEVFP